MSKEKLIGQADQKQIDDWKKKHKTVYAVEVDGHVIYLKKPDRKVMAFASTALESSPFQYVEEIFENCRLGGSDIFDKDDDYYLAAMQKINQIVEVKKAELVKL